MSEFENKVIKLLESIIEKLDKALGGASSSPAKAGPPASSGAMKPSEMIEKQKEEDKLKEKPPVEGRRTCPECNGTAFRTEEDKSNILSMQGGLKIYAKVNICKNCGHKM